MRNEKRKINKLKVGIVVFIFVILILTTSGLGRFVYNVIRDKYLTSKEFYFESNLLKSNGATYTYKNWDGTGIYNFDVELLSKINDLQKLDDDQDYTIMVTFPQKVNCAINTTEFVEPYRYKTDENGNDVLTEEGKKIPLNADQLVVEQPVSANNTIYFDQENKDIATIYVKAICDEVQFTQGEEIEIDVTAYTSSPYKKSLSARFTIEISTSYTIEDSYYAEYALLTVRNTSNLNQYFTVTLNANTLLLDMNDDAWVNRKFYDVDTSGNSPTYRVKSVTFEVPKDTSKQIKLYKKDINTLFTISNIGNSLYVTKKITI